MRARLHLPRGPVYYASALEGLTRVNEEIYRRDPRLPSVYDTRVNVRYDGTDPNEDWLNVREVIRMRRGDCEDLAAARAAELRVRFNDPQARVHVYRSAPKMTHAVVLRGDGVTEDPARRLGMGSKGSTELRAADSIGAIMSRQLVAPRNFAATAARANPPTRRAAVAAPSSLPAAIYALAPGSVDEGDLSDFPASMEDEAADAGESWESVGADPSTSAELSWTVERISNGYRGTVRIPLDVGRCIMVSQTAKGSTPAAKDSAQRKALKAAAGVLDNPTVKSLLPPGAQYALQIVKSKTARNIAKKITSLF